MLGRRQLRSATNAHTLKARTARLKVLHSVVTQCTFQSLSFFLIFPSADTNTTRVPIRQCPVYANRACYQASSLHEDYSDPSVDFEEDYRGCSTFEHTNGEDFTCQSTAIDQISHLNCKCKNMKFFITSNFEIKHHVRKTSVTLADSRLVTLVPVAKSHMILYTDLLV